eukprot:6477569-Prymnesium_polylepis.1
MAPQAGAPDNCVALVGAKREAGGGPGGGGTPPPPAAGGFTVSELTLALLPPSEMAPQAALSRGALCPSRDASLLLRAGCHCGSRCPCRSPKTS